MRDTWTTIGGDETRFGATRWSLVLRAREGVANGRESLEDLVRIYWKPVYAHVRRHWGKTNEDSKDLTQAFFADLLTRPFLARVTPEAGSFRTFLRRCLENFLRNRHDADRALKRGGGTDLLPLQEEAVSGGT